MLKIIFEIALTFLISSASSLLGQQVFAAADGEPQMRMFASGEVVFLPETGAVIMLKDKSLVIDMVSPSEQRAKEYQTVDLKMNDQVLMINGKKVVTISDLKTVYDSVAIGSDVKLGIRRGKDMMIVAFPKADQTKMTQHRVMTVETDDAGEVVSGTGNGKQVMTFRASEGGVAVIPEIGLILHEADSKVKVAGLLEAELNPDKDAVAEGDVVSAIMSGKVKTVKEFTDIYDKIAVGAEFTVSINHGGKTLTLKATKKAKPEGTKIIRTIENN